MELLTLIRGLRMVSPGSGVCNSRKKKASNMENTEGISLILYMRDIL